MNTYIVTYDLSGADSADYEELYEALKAHAKWARITDSTWAIVSPDTASKIRDKLIAVMGGEDRLFVVRTGGGAAWRNVRCRNEWLKRNL